MAFKTTPPRTSVASSPDRLYLELPSRKHDGLFLHQGQILQKYTSDAQDVSDVALQLPTGSGKTLVGLLLAEWRRRTFKERVVYLCPTKQLVNQVAEEASRKYGLQVQPFTGSRANFSPEAKSSYQDAEKVAITTYSGLFNTNPFFDAPDVVIIDDAHAVENYISEHWTFKLNRFEDADKILFNAVVSVLKGVVPESSLARLEGKWEGVEDTTWVDKVPTSQVIKIAQELRAAINSHLGDSKQRHAWSLVADHLGACQLYIGSKEIAIRPLIPPTWTHRPFNDAKQRIYMSATLGEGGDLERLTGRPKITRLPIPEGWDRQGIGRRFFVFPERSFNTDQTLELRRKLMKKAGRSLVLTPDMARANQIIDDVVANVAVPVFQAADIEASKAPFVASPNAVAVIANRYDGIDLPGDDCRLLFIEGLPRATNLQERFLMSRMGANVLFNERIQTRVLQAVGRCTRGLTDYSMVVVTGEDLPNYLTNIKKRPFFHPELQGEILFGIDQSKDVTHDDILDNFDIFLEHKQRWSDANNGILNERDQATQERFPALDELANVVRHEIAWQRAMWSEDYVDAFDSAREVLAGLNHSDLRGYRGLWHYLAGTSADLATTSGQADLSTQVRGQFMKAKEASTGIPWLVSMARGTPHVEEEAGETSMDLELQVEQLETYLDRLGTVHNRSFSDRESEIRNALASGPTFERGQKLLGDHLGFIAGKRESDASPDPWWQAGSTVIVFEDHANAKGSDAMIDAEKARQANGHPNWIREHVPGTKTAAIYSCLVTPATFAKSGAMPHLEKVALWSLADFTLWAEEALRTVRQLRVTFKEPGDLVWRAEAMAELVRVRADAPGLCRWLSSRPAKDLLKLVP